MVSPKMAIAATQTPWPCVVVDGITTSLVSSVKSAGPEHTFRIKNSFAFENDLTKDSHAYCKGFI